MKTKFRHSIPRQCLALLGILMFSVFSIEARAETFVLVTNNYPPYVNTHDPKSNLATRIIGAALKEVGHQLDIKIMPWARCELEVFQGHFIATYPYCPSSQRERNFYFSRPLYSTKDVVFFNRYTTPNFSYHPEDNLKGLRVGLIRGYSWNSQFAMSDAEISLVNNLDSAIKMLLTGRVDIVPEAQAVGEYRLKQFRRDEISKVCLTEMPIKVSPNYVMVSRDHPEGLFFVNELNKGLIKISNNGTLKMILSDLQLSQTSHNH